MSKSILYYTIALLIQILSLHQASAYTPLDTNNPIKFRGDYIIYRGETITLGAHAFFVDGQLSNEIVAKYPYVYNSINSAAKDLTDGTEEKPMVLYIAPYVYWIDNPDDKKIRYGTGGNPPYGLEISCQWLRFYGLSDDPKNVVLACNRGQQVGAEGNFTMLRISGNGTSSENITFGNYCNVDLNYPLKPKLNRKKRADAIVQAQLIHCNGDKIVTRNTRFISRLNLCNFVGAKRILFDRCHMESTDDALCGTGVYLNCTLDFYSSKPFYHTTGTGAVFLNCDIQSLSGSSQHFTKANGQLAVIDTRFYSTSDKYISWNDITPINTRNYQSNISLNQHPYFIGYQDSASTVDISHKRVLNAYRFRHNDTTYYNVYNLLKGDDEWDPTHMNPVVIAAEKANKVTYGNIPTQMKLHSSKNLLITGTDTAIINADILRFGNYKSSLKKVTWRIASKDSAVVKLISNNNQSCQIIPTNRENKRRKVVLYAVTDDGLEAATEIDISPKLMDAPKFDALPKLAKPKNGQLAITYKLDTNLDDQSKITWYRCTNKQGSNPISVATSHASTPLKSYMLSEGDIGYYIMAIVVTHHQLCKAGTNISAKAITGAQIKAKDVKGDKNILKTDFIDLSVENKLIKPGFWTFTNFSDADTTKSAPWMITEGRQGNANMYGLLQTERSATLLYTPIAARQKNMHIEMVISPYKTAGQGFSVAPLYMDILIKLDTKTKTGYGLRFQRTTKYSNAVDCYFVRYDNGKIEPVSKETSTSCFRTPCTIKLSVEGNKLRAQASTEGNFSNPKHPEIVPIVDITTTIEPSLFGGFGILYNGGSTTMINSVNISWK